MQILCIILKKLKTLNLRKNFEITSKIKNIRNKLKQVKEITKAKKQKLKIKKQFNNMQKLIEKAHKNK